jgi:hypothetical protein
MADYREKLLIHAAAYFATIDAGKDPGPMDPFLAGLIEEAIREKAGIANGVPHANGVHGSADPPNIGASALAVFKVFKAAGADGLMVAEAAERAGIPRVNVQFHALALERRKLLGKASKGRYYVTWDGAAVPVPVLDGSGVPGSMRAELQRRGLSHPGPLNVKLAEYSKAAGRDVTSRELGRHIGAKTTSVTAKAMTPLLRIGIVQKVAVGVYRYVAG